MYNCGAPLDCRRSASTPFLQTKLTQILRRNMKLLRMLGIALVAVAAVGVASAQSWTPVQHVPVPAGAIALLTDGRVLVHEEQSNAGTWYTLTPDINGHYETGTWTL